MSDLTFYTNPMSRGRIARWMLEEVGAPYETIVVSYGAEMHGPDYLSVNPMGKVPALRHNDAVVTECAAICTYLADAFPEAGLGPGPDLSLRAAFLRWMFFAAGPLEAAVVNSSFGWQADSPQQEGRLGYGSLSRVLDVLEAQLTSGPWFLGERFSAVDVYLGSQIVWGLQFGTFDARPAFQNYAEDAMARPAAIRAREIDDALLPKDQG